MSMTKHFVTFFSPGTLVAETDKQEIPAWDVAAAVEMAGKINQRHGARPYGFMFSTYERGDEDFEPQRTKTSNIYYLGGKIETLADVEARNDPKEKILRDNMRCNNIPKIIVNDNSWRFTGAFNEGDVLLDVKLPPREQG